jgi:hypothetical protein
MDVAPLLLDLFGRIPPLARSAVADLDAERLTARPGPDANPIAWLVWHLTRVQDDHVAEVADREQVWTAAGWVQRFALDLDPAETGYRHDSAAVAAVRVDDPQLLVDYYDAVHSQTLQFLAGISDADLDRIVDRRWDPPVTLGVRLVSVIDDDAQHGGQAAFLRGLLERR